MAQQQQMIGRVPFLALDSGGSVGAGGGCSSIHELL